MSINVLVADDSATIQKVVSITLANESVNLMSCESEGELLVKIQEGSVHGVLLDFGLSQDKSGFELIKSILAVNPYLKILTMLPAFEQVDEATLAEAGSFASIAKPFESAKFISAFRDMVAHIDEESNNIDSAEKLIEDSKSDSGIGDSIDLDTPEDSFDPDQWVSNTSFSDHSQVDEVSPVEAALTNDNSDDFFNDPPSKKSKEVEIQDINGMTVDNELSETISDWGIELPTPIGNDHGTLPVFPPIIDGKDPIVSAAEKPSSENEFENEFNDEHDPFMQGEESSVKEDSLFSDSSDEDVDEWSMPNQKVDDLSRELEKPIVEAIESIESNEGPALEDSSSSDIKFEEDTENVSVGGDADSENELLEEEEDAIYPEDDDLDYPDMGMMASPSDSAEPIKTTDDDPIVFDDPAAVSAKERRPQFVNFDNLELQSGQSQEASKPSRDTSQLEEELASDIDPQNFWDEDADLASSGADAVAPDNNVQAQQASMAAIDREDIDKFFNEIKIELLERVDRIVREVCEEKIEKVAWEVIPEIAENLIKKEISSIGKDEEFR